MYHGGVFRRRARSTLLRQRRGRVVWSKGEPSVYTLSMEPGAFTLTGSDVDLLYNRRLDMEAGSFTLTGSDMVFFRGYRLSMSPGAFTLIGSDVDLLHNRRLDMAAGAFTLTGSDLDLLFNRRLDMEAGSFALTGSSLYFYSLGDSRAWAFVLDGHIFYVMNTVDGDTIVCDLRTGQWHHWYTGSSESVWNMHRGMMWQGHIIACDAKEATIWEVDPESVLDEEETEISRVVTGFQPIRGKPSIRQGSLRVTASMGEPSDSPATVRMRWSDDEGDTWSSWKSITLNDEEYTQVLRYRGLGRMRAPGRVWEVADEGGLIRIEGIDSDIG